MEKINLLNYQREVVEDMDRHERWIYWMQQRTGKTLVILENIHRHPERDSVLIVTRKLLKETSFHTDNNRFYGMNIQDAVFEKKDGKFYSNLGNEKVRAYLINYECLVRNAALVKAYHWDAVYLDEGHAVCNRSSKTSKLFYKWSRKQQKMLLFPSDRIYIFTGTLIPNKEEQGFGVLAAVGGVTKCWSKWKLDYFHNPVPTNPFLIELRPDKKDEFYGLIASYSTKVDRADTEETDGLKWSQKQYIHMKFPMTPEQSEAHRAIKEDGVYGDIIVDYNIQTMNYLSQIVSGFMQNIPLKISYSFPSHRADALRHVLTEVERNKKYFVVFYHYDKDICDISAVAKSTGINMFLLTSNARTSVMAIKAWKRNGGMLVTQYIRGKNGLTLTEADVEIYYSLLDNNEAFEQSSDRIIGMSQKSDVCKYYMLVAQGSIDEVIVRSLQYKHNIQVELKNWIERK